MTLPDLVEGVPYVEALPRFNIVTLAAACRRGEQLLFWYDEHRRLVGGASIALHDAVLDLSYGFHTESGHVVPGSEVCDFEIVQRDDGQRGERIAIICPGCNRQKEILLCLDYQWRCRKCHGVKNLSNSLDDQTRNYIRLIELRKFVSSGRPKGMHHSTFAKIEGEYRHLKAHWGNKAPRVLRAEHQFRVNERYFKAGEAPLPSDPEPPDRTRRRQPRS